MGDHILTIGKNRDKETVNYSIHFYDADHKIMSSKSFQIEGGETNFFNITKYEYNIAKKLVSMSKGSSDNFKLINEYFYDEQDRLIEVIGPVPGGGDKLLSFYESPESEKVIEEHFFWDRPTVQPYYIYKVNYDHLNRLSSKTVQKENLGGEIAGFEYFYTNDGLLSEEKEYDLHLGQQLVRTTVYEYY